MKKILFVLGAVGIVLLGAAIVLSRRQPPPAPFSGERAYEHVLAQVEINPRHTGSPGGWATGDYIIKSLESNAWRVRTQEFDYMGVRARNIVGTVGQGPQIIVGAHYDTRKRADHDPVSPDAPVPGANDGASGVAVLLELARVLDKAKLQNQVELAFFDAEDNGYLDGWEWIVGSSYFAQHLDAQPAVVIIVDMIGDADQQVYWERNSNAEWNQRIWQVAASLGYQDYLMPYFKHSMLDDHTPFLARGIPAVDMIDFDYPYWHTTADTADKVSPASLERIGRTLQVLLEEGAQP
ncbi:MAG: M28 family peptidase [Thermoflexales bacterium]|nr:M28 family peptidase [Thermoflexales bacterium]